MTRPEHPKERSISMIMKASVIVSTYNSPRWLEKVFWGLAAQNIRNFEVIVADDGSTEETKYLIERYRQKLDFPITHVWHEDIGFRKCRILNKAILAAGAEYLIFIDGDCVPRQDFVAAHTRFAKPRTFLSGTYCKLPMETSVLLNEPEIVSGKAFDEKWLRENGYEAARRHRSKLRAAAWGLDGLLNRISPSTARFNGNNSSCWRSDAIAVGGFDERMGYGSEDHEFGYRLVNAGIRARHIRYSAVCLHLDHAHGYVDPIQKSKNSTIVQLTLSQRLRKTDFGLNGAQENNHG